MKNFYSKVKPFLVLFFSKAGRLALAAARDIVPAMLANTSWTDQMRREYAVEKIKRILGEEYPGSAWIINMAIEYVVGMYRARAGK